VAIHLDDTAMIFIRGERVTLEIFGKEHITDAYRRWLNDPEVNLFTSRGYYPVTEAECDRYVQICQSPDRIVLAIKDMNEVFCDKKGNISHHLGNISLQKIDILSRSAELAIMIGEKSAWGKGYGLEASRLLCAHGFNQLGLHRIYCGTHAKNFGMQKLAFKLGMKEEGASRQAIFKDGVFADVIHYGMLKEEFQ
jgi:[ribosomal protein S5]-alanine N-acetyltransferase